MWQERLNGNRSMSVLFLSRLCTRYPVYTDTEVLWSFLAVFYTDKVFNKNKERKFHFRFVKKRFLAAINCTGSAEGALVPVLLRITHWPKSGLPVSPPGLFPPCRAGRSPLDFALAATPRPILACASTWACSQARVKAFYCTSVLLTSYFWFVKY